jgi:hypothetical protein
VTFVTDQSDSDVYGDLHEEEEQPGTSNQRVYRRDRTVKQADGCPRLQHV